MFTAAVTGYATAFSLILAIGAQNAFVLRQGLLRQHVLAICTICAVSDAVLIIAGVFGFGALVDAFPWFPKAMRFAGAGFLFVYGALRFWSAWHGAGSLAAGKSAGSLRNAVLTCLALTWANPHVYLDTVGLIGAVSTRFEGSEKVVFAVAASFSSFTFFFGLGFGARLLAPLMASALSWKILDALIGAIMWSLAYWLITGH